MFQPEATSANDVLAVAWERDGVHVVRRDLKYVTEDDGSWRAQEKGIDVALAIGVVEAAINGDFDVVVIFSNDTDQLPTLELVFHKLPPQVEIACWATAKPLWFPEGLRATPPRRLPFCHFLNEGDFLACRDYLPSCGAVDQFTQNVGMSGVPGGLGGHVSHGPAQRAWRTGQG